jgi:hypothetical protein
MISQRGMRLELGARTIKKKKIAKGINLFFFIKIADKIKRSRITETEIQVGYANNDFETLKS